MDSVLVLVSSLHSSYRKMVQPCVEFDAPSQAEAKSHFCRQVLSQPREIYAEWPWLSHRVTVACRVQAQGMF